MTIRESNDVGRNSLRRKSLAAVTLAEVVIAMAVISMALGGIIEGYLISAKRAEWSAYSFAAQSLSAQGVEQARAAKWDPLAYPIVDEMAPGTFTTNEVLDVPISQVPVWATNYVTVTQISASPSIRQIRCDCVWFLMGRGPFTNSTITFRAPDQ